MAANLPIDSIWTRKTTRLCHLSLRRPLIISLCQLVVASPLVILSLRRPLIVLSCQLVVAVPLAVLFLRHPLILWSCFPRPLVAPHSCPLIAPAGCCLVAPAGCRIIISHRHLVAPPSRLLSSHHAGWLLCCHSLRAAPLVLLSCRPSSSHCHCLALPSPSNAVECCCRHQMPMPPPPLNAVSIVHR
jgi:hypothetical protein